MNLNNKVADHESKWEKFQLFCRGSENQNAKKKKLISYFIAGGTPGTNSMLMTCHCPDLGSASHWSRHKGNFLQPIKSATQIWVVTRHQYKISALVPQTSFIRRETRGGVFVAKGRLFSQAIFEEGSCVYAQLRSPP